MSPSSAGSEDRRINEDISDITLVHASLNSTHPHSSGASMLLWMLVDGVGLAIIAACTILEGFELWTNYFNEYLEFNVASLTFWFTGRFCQIVGLISLIIHAASMQVFHELEWAGMIMLTAGPVLNMCACSIFDSGADTSYLFNKQWMTSESLELLGIIILDLSLIEGPEHLVLSAEIIGFMTLACAAILDFEYTIDHTIPAATFRVDLIHASDCFGLSLLTIVAIGQYHIKVAKHKISHGSVSSLTHSIVSVSGSSHGHKVHGNPQLRGQGFNGNESGHSGDKGMDDNLENGPSEMSNLIPASNGVSSHHTNQNQNSSLHRNISSPYHVSKGPYSGITGIKAASKLSGSHGEKRFNSNGASILSQDEQHND